MGHWTVNYTGTQAFMNMSNIRWVKVLIQFSSDKMHIGLGASCEIN